MNMLAEEYRCAVLYPEQSVHSNPLRCWNWFESTSLAGQGRAALIAHLIDQVTERRPMILDASMLWEYRPVVQWLACWPCATVDCLPPVLPIRA
jgi:hypothetical protein